ncbi:hypothetical protein B6G06_05300 [Actinomyces gaoshouyii]|nr:hypothetical protein B6G06_05300 [Actinomyces gaoshouyii]
MGVGVASCAAGVVITRIIPVSPGAMIVILLVGGYAPAALIDAMISAVRSAPRRQEAVDDRRAPGPIPPR